MLSLRSDVVKQEKLVESVALESLLRVQRSFVHTCEVDEAGNVIVGIVPSERGKEPDAEGAPEKVFEIVRGRRGEAEGSLIRTVYYRYDVRMDAWGELPRDVSRIGTDLCASDSALRRVGVVDETSLACSFGSKDLFRVDLTTSQLLDEIEKTLELDDKEMEAGVNKAELVCRTAELEVSARV